jgi:hypothetical protein
MPKDPSQPEASGIASRPRSRGALLATLAAGLAALAASAAVYHLLRPAPRGETHGAAAQAPTGAPVTPATGGADAPAASMAIRLEVAPIEAVVDLDGTPTRDNPILLPRDGRSHTLAVRAPGYDPVTREVRAGADTIVSVSLQRAAAPARDGGAPARPRAPAEPPGRRLNGPMETSL